MQKVWHKLTWLLISVVVVIIDQVTKYQVMESFEHNVASPITPFFNVTPTHNKGIAFSLFDHSHEVMHVLVTLSTIVISVFIMIWFWRLNLKERLAQASLALILGGAIGNIIDRLILSHVRDFLHFYWQDYHFAIFNIADAAITIGATLMIIDVILHGRQNSPEESA